MFRLGFVIFFINSACQGGFLCGVILTVMIGQLKPALGLDVSLMYGPLSLLHNIVKICKALPGINLYCLMFVSVYLLLVVVKGCLHKKLTEKLKVSIPVELILLILAIIISQFVNVNTKYGVSVVGYIPMGFPKPSVPITKISWEAVPSILTISLVNLVVFGVNIRIFNEYQVAKMDFNREIFAVGISSIFGSFFPCMAVGAGLLSAFIMKSTGGKTIVSHLIATLTLVVLFSMLGSLVRPLPLCILSIQMIISLFPTFVSDICTVRKLWKDEKKNFLIWIASFGFVVLYDTKLSILVGVILSVLSILIGFHQTPIGIIERIPDTDVYENKNLYETSRIDHVMIISYNAPLLFINSETFLSKFENDCFPLLYGNTRNKDTAISCSDSHFPLDDDSNINRSEPRGVEYKTVTHVILDCKAISTIDASGVIVLIEVYKQLHRMNIKLILTSCSFVTRRLLRQFGYHDVEETPSIYPSIPAALQAIHHGQSDQYTDPHQSHCGVFHVGSVNMEDTYL